MIMQKDIPEKEIANVTVDFDFDAPYTKAAAYFEKMGVVTADVFYDDLITHAGQSFTVSYINSTETLESIRDYLKEGLASGNVDPNEIHKAIQEFAILNGDSPLAPYHVQNVIRTNLQSSFGEAQYQNIKNSVNPYVQYFAVGDERTSDLCLSLDGKVFRIEDPIWDDYCPPNHFQCRSKAYPLDDLTLQEEGLTVTTDGREYLKEQRKENPNIEAGEGFKGNPKRSYLNYLKEKRKGLPINKLDKMHLNEKDVAIANAYAAAPSWKSLTKINKTLTIKEKEYAKMLERTLEKVDTYNGTTYSNIILTPAEVKKFNEDIKTWQPNNFLSSTKTKPSKATDNQLILTIKSNAGKDLSETGINEVLFAQSTNFKVENIKIKEVNNYKTIDMVLSYNT